MESRNHILKWLIIGSLGTMAIFVLFIGILIFTFTPLVTVDETTGQVSLFGGAVQVRARDVITKLSKEGSFVFGKIGGVEKLTEDIGKLEIKFSTGEVRVDYNETAELNWDCDGAGKNTQLQKFDSEGRVLLDFSGAFVDCDVVVPKIPLKIAGSRGQIEVRKISSALDIKLNTGDVYLQAVEGLNYIYNIDVVEGADGSVFTSSEEANSIPVNVEIKVGNVLPLD